MPLRLGRNRCSHQSVLPSLMTDRMLLRPFTDADLGWLTALHTDPAVMRYIDRVPVSPAVVASQTLPRFLREYADLPEGLGHASPPP